MRHRNDTFSEALLAGCLFVFLLFFLLIISSIPSHGQVAAAAWCVVQSSNQSDQSSPQPDDSFPPQPDEEQSSSLGCDVGIGFLFYQYKHLGLVGVVGSESIGTGIAWIINPRAKSSTDHRPIMAVAVGVATPYDSNGIGKDLQLTLGMTLSLRKGE